jgi:hypothetical protein
VPAATQTPSGRHAANELAPSGIENEFHALLPLHLCLFGQQWSAGQVVRHGFRPILIAR